MRRIGIAVDADGDVGVAGAHRRQLVGVEIKAAEKVVLRRRIGGTIRIRGTIHAVGIRRSRAAGAGDHRPHIALRDRHPQQALHLPRFAQVLAVGRHRGQLGGIGGHPMSLHMVGVTVETVLVVADQHLRLAVPDQRYQFIAGLQQVDPPEAIVVQIVGSDHFAARVGDHPGVAPAAVAAEPDEVGDAERRHRRRQLFQSARGEGIVGVELQMRQLGDHHLPISPSVQVTRVTAAPSAAYLAIVAPVPDASSSGWACTNISLRFALLVTGTTVGDGTDALGFRPETSRARARRTAVPQSPHESHDQSGPGS